VTSSNDVSFQQVFETSSDTDCILLRLVCSNFETVLPFKVYNMIGYDICGQGYVFIVYFRGRSKLVSFLDQFLQVDIVRGLLTKDVDLSLKKSLC